MTKKLRRGARRAVPYFGPTTGTFCSVAYTSSDLLLNRKMCRCLDPIQTEVGGSIMFDVTMATIF